MKKGFTLIEIMAVILIISTVCLTSVIMFDKSLENAKKSNLETMLTEIDLAADVYLSENESEMINVNNGEVICTKLYLLQNEGLIENNLKDPMNNTKINGSLCVYSCLHKDENIEENTYLVHELEGYRQKPYNCNISSSK